jgi:hypothetical protein
VIRELLETVPVGAVRDQPAVSNVAPTQPAVRPSGGQR